MTTSKEVFAKRREGAVDERVVGAAHATGLHRDADVIATRRGGVDFGEFQR